MQKERHNMETTKTKILIVDDNFDLASIIHEMLETEGYEVELAGDGQKGYFAYLLFRPDIVITDIQMPVKNGLELIQNIRMHDPEAKIIYMSGDLSSYMELLKKEKERYHAGLIEKPFSKKELMQLVLQLLPSVEKDEVETQPIQIDEANHNLTDLADGRNLHPRDKGHSRWNNISQSIRPI
jgi:DNA-binding response OmpR family regulator